MMSTPYWSLPIAKLMSCDGADTGRGISEAFQSGGFRGASAADAEAIA
jgi:hypothetical protein